MLGVSGEKLVKAICDLGFDLRSAVSRGQPPLRSNFKNKISATVVKASYFQTDHTVSACSNTPVRAQRQSRKTENASFSIVSVGCLEYGNIYIFPRKIFHPMNMV